MAAWTYIIMQLMTPLAYLWDTTFDNLCTNDPFFSLQNSLRYNSGYDRCFRDTEVKLYSARCPSWAPALVGELRVAVVLRHVPVG